MRALTASLILGLCFCLSSLSAAKSADTLYDKLGGEDGMSKIVKGMMDYSRADKRIAHTFENSYQDRLVGIITLHFCAIADGPCEYDGQEMHKVHHGLGLQTKHFNALVENLQKSMNDQKVPFGTQGKLLARLAPMHHDIIVRSRTGK